MLRYTTQKFKLLNETAAPFITHDMGQDLDICPMFSTEEHTEAR